MWNDTDTPIGYLITFPCYGTWLPGDKRGAVDREHRRYKSPYAPANAKRSLHNQAQLKSEPVLLTALQRGCVEQASQNTCALRKGNLHACNAHTNHVHTVVSIGTKKPEIALNAFKANATREMRKGGHWQHAHSPWVDHGSKRYLWTERHLALAVDYILNGQGGDLPDFG